VSLTDDLVYDICPLQSLCLSGADTYVVYSDQQVQRLKDAARYAASHETVRSTNTCHVAGRNSLQRLFRCP